MRDEDLKKLPQSIEAWKVREFLEGLGISHKDVFDMHVGVRSVEISLYATNEEGRRFPAADGKGAAQHTISVPFTGSWDAPRPAASYMPPEVGEPGFPVWSEIYVKGDEVGDGRCPVRRNLQPGGRCLRDADHTGDHHYSQVSGAVAPPKRCEEENPNGVVCQEVWAHDGEHMNGETFWR